MGKKAKHKFSAKFSKPITGDDDDNLIDLSDQTDGRRINSGDGNDTVLAGSGHDRINAGDGDDIVNGGAGNDVMFGNDGHDTAVYDGSIFGFLWETLRGNTLRVTDTDSGDGDEGIDALKHFEVLQFDDYSFNIGGDNAALVLADDQSTDEDSSVDFSIDAFDFDGGAVSLDSVQTASGSTVVLNSTQALAVGMGVGLRYFFTFTPAPGFQSLALNQTGYETVTFEVSDGQGNVAIQSIQVAIAGLNDAPVIDEAASDLTGDVQEDVTLSATGSIEASDIDDGAVLSYAVQGGGAGTYGALSIDADGDWTYTLANNTDAVQNLAQNETHDETFTIVVTDEHGAQDTVDVTVTVEGQNDAPVIDEDSTDTSGGVQEDVTLSIGGVIAASDNDNGAVLSYSVLGGGVGTYGTLSVDTDGNWTFALANGSLAVQSLAQGQTVSETFTVVVSDEHGAQDTIDVDIDIDGQNDAPEFDTVTSDSTGNVQEDGTLIASGQLFADDIDTLDTLTFDLQGAGEGTYGTIIVDSDGNWTYELSNNSPTVNSLGTGDVVYDSFDVEVSDGHGGVDTITIDIQVDGVDNAPPPPGTLTFEFFDGTDPISGSAYGGLTWSADWFSLDGSTFQPRGSDGRGGVPANGYYNGIVSVSQVAFNAGGNDVTLSRDTDFDLESAYFAAAWNDGLTLEVSGYDDGVLVGTQTLTLNTTGPLFVEFDDAIFDSVDEVVFHSYGGTNPGLGGSGTQFVMDDLLIL